MNVLTEQQRIAAKARSAPELRFTSLNHHLNPEWLQEAYRRTRKDRAPGIDGQTGLTYAENLGVRLCSLMHRAKTGSYKAPPVRRVHIPKGTGTETRPLGIPTFEDKVLQRAVTMLLEPIYEQDFLDCSYGFRPGRSAHSALRAIRQQITDLKVGWILDVDIRKYFDTLDHAHLRRLLDLRVRDGVIRRLIGKWLKAGVMEEGHIHYPEAGTPQGGVISPLLSNIYLHYVLDQWFETTVKAHLAGRAFLVRYADDFIMGFENRTDAERVLRVLHKRFMKYGLALHPEKTRLVPFGRPPLPTAPGPDLQRPGTFDFLSFTHYWDRTRAGGWTVKRKTARSRFTRTLERTREWCRKNRHLPFIEQSRRLYAALRGHIAYFGIRCNVMWLSRLQHAVRRIWQKWLNRRTRRRSRLPWKTFNHFLGICPMPIAKVIHHDV